mmetsp:Transcript_25460/g.64625  ORF Transcript_25460/g.64625 Transcript_25460/m.64625 type:complete len:192 (-) Transcript_25460:276-851(-)
MMKHGSMVLVLGSIMLIAMAGAAYGIGCTEGPGGAKLRDRIRDSPNAAGYLADSTTTLPGLFAECFTATIKYSGQYNGAALQFSGNISGGLMIGTTCSQAQLATMAADGTLSALAPTRELLGNSSMGPQFLTISDVKCCSDSQTFTSCNRSPVPMIQFPGGNGRLAGTLARPLSLLALALAGAATLALAMF